MNCDQAFDCLTDPHRRDTPELARHLAGCPRCRAMKDALEPALELFDELVTEPDLGALARSAGSALSTDSLQLAEHTAARLAEQPRPGRRPAAAWRSGLRYAAVAVLGAGIALAVQATVDDPAASGPGHLPRCLWQDRAAAEELRLTPELLSAQCSRCHHAVWLTPQDGSGSPMSRRDFLKARVAIVLRNVNPASAANAELFSDLLMPSVGEPLRALATLDAPPSTETHHATT